LAAHRKERAVRIDAALPPRYFSPRPASRFASGAFDEDEARGWYQRSAQGGCPQGHLGYALALAKHPNLSERKNEIAEHIGLAAAAGLPTAIYMLGVLSEEGVGLERDPAAAAKLFAKPPNSATSVRY
jgi:TPR repeat protein